MWLKLPKTRALKVIGRASLQCNIMYQLHLCVHCRKADQVFADNDLWKSVPDRDRRDLYDDILHQLEKKEKVRAIHV